MCTGFPLNEIYSDVPECVDRFGSVALESRSLGEGVADENEDENEVELPDGQQGGQDLLGQFRARCEIEP